MIQKDILLSDENIICHQVNCKGVMGKGLALQLRNKYPLIYTEYKKVCDKYTSNTLLGLIQIIKYPNKYIVNMFAQDNYGYGKQYTDYTALTECFKKLNTFAQKENLSVAIPYKIGCGLAGGDWNIVQNIIQENLKCRYNIYKK